jgi:hypothetical protein
MPRLRTLQVRASLLAVRQLFGIALPDLRSLGVYSPSELALDVLAENQSLAQLGRLYLDAGWDLRSLGEPVPFVFVADHLGPFLAAGQFASLTDLTLRAHDLGDAGCAAIARSGILRRLKRLDLRYCDITDVGAEALSRSPDLRHLEWLDVGGNQITPIGVSRLQETAPETRVQWDSTWGDYPLPDEGGDMIV